MRSPLSDTNSRLTLQAATAADLMSPNPVSIRADASVREVVGLLVDHGYSAAPVIDEAGRPVGVVSRSDILVHDRERDDYVRLAPRLRQERDVPSGFDVVDVDRTTVGDIMTPVVFAVPLHAAGAKVVEEMLSLRVHQLFVVDAAGVLVGVISALDVLRHLHPDPALRSASRVVATR